MRTYEANFDNSNTGSLPAAETYFNGVNYYNSTNASYLSDDLPYRVEFGTRILGYTFHTATTPWVPGVTYNLNIYKNAVLETTISITSGSQGSQVAPDIVVAAGDLISASWVRTDGTVEPDYSDIVYLGLFLEEA